MKVKATNPMKTAINAALNGEAVASIEKLTPDVFRAFIDFSLFDHLEDYNTKTGLYQVIKITYPPECFAVPQYLTTKDLARIFRNSDRSYNGFFEALRDYIAI